MQQLIPSLLITILSVLVHFYASNSLFFTINQIFVYFKVDCEADSLRAGDVLVGLVGLYCFLLECMDPLAREELVLKFWFSVSLSARVVGVLGRMELLLYRDFLIYLSALGLSRGRGDVAMAVPRCLPAVAQRWSHTIGPDTLRQGGRAPPQGTGNVQVTPFLLT